MCHRYRETHTNTRTNTHTSTHISAHPHSHSLMLPWACLPSAQWHLKGAASSPASCQVSFFKAAEADQMLKIPQVLSVHIDFAFSCYVSAPPQHHPTGHPIHPLTLLPFALHSQLCPFKCHVIPLNMYFVVVLLLAVHFFLVTQLRPKTN